MAQISILESPLNNLTLPFKDRNSMDIAYTMGLNLPYIDMFDIHLETEMEINNAFAQARSRAVPSSKLSGNYELKPLGNVDEHTLAFKFLKDGEELGTYIARREGSFFYLIGRGLVTLKVPRS